MSEEKLDTTIGNPVFSDAVPEPASDIVLPAETAVEESLPNDQEASEPADVAAEPVAVSMMKRLPQMRSW